MNDATLTSNQDTFIDKEDILNFLGELMADYVDREQLGKADLVGDAIKLITAVEPVAPSSPPADPDQEPSRADKLRAALKPAGVKVTVLGEADEPKTVLPPAKQGRQRLGEIPADASTACESREAGEAAGGSTVPPPKPAHEREPPHCSSCSCGMPTPPPAATQVEEVLCAGVVVSSPHDRRITLRFETDEQFRAAEVLIGIADCQVIDTAVTKSEGSPLTVPGMQFPVETEATPVECPKSPTQFHVTKIGGQVCVYCGPESEEASP